MLSVVWNFIEPRLLIFSGEDISMLAYI